MESKRVFVRGSYVYYDSHLNDPPTFSRFCRNSSQICSRGCRFGQTKIVEIGKIANLCGNEWFDCLKDPWDWYIYLHLPYKSTIHVGINISVPWIRHGFGFDQHFGGFNGL